jgi:hypothetical protein
MAGRLVTIAGRVLDSSGKSLEGGMISLVPQDTDVVMVGITGRGIQPDGSFVVPGVTPGAYTITVMASGRRPMAGPDEAAEVESASVSIVVSDEDVEGLVITTSPPSTIAGRVIVEGDEAALRGVQLRMLSRPLGDMPMTMGVRGTGSVDENFSVRMSGLRGEQVLSLTGLPRGWWVKSIRIGGQNALRGFDFGTGRKLTGLEIVVNNRPASIGGQVTRPDGQPASDYMVFVFPEDLDNYHGPRIQGTGGTALPDQDGTYVVEGLRPGRYYAIAVERGQLEMSGMDDPDALRALSQKAQAVEIAEGEQQYLSLRLVTP